MYCPKDDSYTYTDHVNGVEIDLCPKCQGVWLDRGELSTLVGTKRDLKLEDVQGKMKEVLIRGRSVVTNFEPVGNMPHGSFIKREQRGKPEVDQVPATAEPALV